MGLRSILSRKWHNLSPSLSSFFALPISARDGFLWGLIYSSFTTSWVWSVLPTEWLLIPTFPKGLLLILAALIFTAITVALPFIAWSASRRLSPLFLRPLICPTVIALGWSVHPLPCLEPGYLLAYTPLDFLAHYGGVHILTFFIFYTFEHLSLLLKRPYLSISLLSIPFLLPQPTYTLFHKGQTAYIIQPATQRTNNPSPSSGLSLLDKVPRGATVIFPESFLNPKTHPSNWEHLIAGRTAIWGELRSQGHSLRNSLVIQVPGQKLFTYDKMHLAPGVEWLGPPGLDIIIHSLTGWPPFTSGTTHPLWQSQAGPVALAICYESSWSFPRPARYSLVLANDDWLGSAFTFQRDLVERIRAIESGTPVIRVANRNSAISFPDRNPIKFGSSAGVFPIVLP
jgi:apolipoprotein N-acyltransferase